MLEEVVGLSVVVVVVVEVSGLDVRESVVVEIAAVVVTLAHLLQHFRLILLHC